MSKAIPIWLDLSEWSDDFTESMSIKTGNLGAVTTIRASARETMKDEILELMKEIPIPLCPVCGSDMRLVEPGEGKAWEPFFGCTRYTDGCRGSRNIEHQGATNKYAASTEDVVTL